MFLPKEAKKLKLIDEVIFFNDFQNVCNGGKNAINLDVYKKKLFKLKYSKNKIFVIPIILPIEDLSFWKAYLKFYEYMIVNESHILLIVNCPGGHDDVMEYMCNWVERLRKQGKYVIAYVQDIAASAGQGLISSCDYIIANQSSCVGSIGTVQIVFDNTQQFKKKGYDLDFIKFHDSAFNPDIGLTEKYKDFLKRFTQNSDFSEFVKKKRSINLKGFDEGQIFTGKAAKNLNLVDCDQGFFSLTEKLNLIFKNQTFYFKNR